MLKAALLLVVYALIVAGLGVLAFLIAPPQASAGTALVVTGAGSLLALACAVLCVMGRSPNANAKAHRLGMIGVHVGLLVPVLMLVGVLMRAIPATSALLDAKSRQAEARGSDASPAGDAIAALADAVLPTEQATADRTALDKDYLVVTLWALAGVSGVALLALLLLRPVPTKPAADAKA